MAATDGGMIGSGVRVAYATTSPHTWNKLEKVRDVTLPTAVNDKLNTTVHGPNDFKQNIAGLAEVTDTTVKMLRVPSTSLAPIQNGLPALRAAHTLLWWRIEIPADEDHSVDSFWAYEFQARVGSVKDMAPIDNIQEREITLVFGGTSFVQYNPMSSAIG